MEERSGEGEEECLRKRKRSRIDKMNIVKETNKGARKVGGRGGGKEEKGCLKKRKRSTTGKMNMVNETNKGAREVGERAGGEGGEDVGVRVRGV